MEQRAPVDARLVEWTRGPEIELAPSVVAARGAVEAMGRRLLEVGDDRLEAVWPWPGADRAVEVDVRSGFYFIYELLEIARAEAIAAIIADGETAPAGTRRASASTAARWSLHGLLLPLADADLDRDPGGGEWPIRETLGHVLSSQRSYGRFTAWWLSQASAPAERIPEDLVDELPERAEEAAGSIADVRSRLDALLDLSMTRLGGLDEDLLEVPARWSGGVVTVGFRLGRWASHLREHTIQVEKTLVMLDRQPAEVERLVRLLFEAYGRLEEVVFGRNAAQINARTDGGASAGDVLARVTSELPSLVAGIRAAAEANVRPPASA